jgi:hypothetical protein
MSKQPLHDVCAHCPRSGACRMIKAQESEKAVYCPVYLEVAFAAKEKALRDRISHRPTVAPTVGINQFIN